MLAIKFFPLILLPLVLTMESTPTVTISMGQLYGQVIDVGKNQKVDIFLSIPYAEKPVRFQKSLIMPLISRLPTW